MHLHAKQLLWFKLNIFLTLAAKHGIQCNLLCAPPSDSQLKIGLYSDTTGRPNCTARSAKIPQEKADKLRMYPTNSSCWKIDQPRQYRPAPTDTNTRQYCLGKRKHGLKWRLMGTECTLATVGYRLRQALPVSNVFPFAKRHLPRGLRISIGPCCRPSRCSVEPIYREPWCLPPSLPPCPPAWQFAIGRVAAARSIHYPTFGKSGSRNETTFGILWSDRRAQTVVKSDAALLYWSSGEVFLSS